MERSTLSSLRTTLSRIRITSSKDKSGIPSNSGLLCSPTRLKSICCKTEDPRRGHNPSPVILMHPVSFNFLRFSLALMESKTARRMLSVIFVARLVSSSPKSRTSHCSPRMTLLNSSSPPTAIANIALDGRARKLAANDSASFGRSRTETPLLGEILLRLGLPSFIFLHAFEEGLAARG